MLRIRIEMLPHGDERESYLMGEIVITNDGTGTDDCGSYDFTLSKEPPIARQRGEWKRGKVLRFSRKKLGPYDLLYRVLKQAVGYRNK